MIDVLPPDGVDSNEDFRVVVADEDHQAPIQMCTPHYTDLCHELRIRGMPIDVATDSVHMKAFYGLVWIATKALGTNDVVRFQCPVCALQQFDYITEIVKVLKDNPHAER